MRSGLIIYVVGKEPSNWDADVGEKTIKQNVRADLVEIITAQTGHFDVLDAWCSLMVRGDEPDYLYDRRVYTKRHVGAYRPRASPVRIVVGDAKECNKAQAFCSE